MKNDTITSMLLNRGLSTDEENRLDLLDQIISTELISAGMTSRFGWLARDESGTRTLCLVDWAEPKRPVFAIASAELQVLSNQSLLEMLRSCLVA